MKDRDLHQVENPAEKPRPVKGSWFRTHLDANKLFPQKMRVIRLYDACEVLMNPPSDFMDYRNSQLTPGQIKRLKGEMNESHHTIGVLKQTKDSQFLNQVKERYPKLDEKAIIVEEQRLNDVWRSGVDGVLRMILQEIHNGPPLPSREVINAYEPVDMISPHEVESINEYWHDSKNTDRVLKQQEGAKFIYKILTNKREGGFTFALSDVWKELITKDEAERGIKNFYDNTSAREYITRNYSPGVPRFDSGSIIPFLNDVQKAKIAARDTTADKDLVFQVLKHGIEEQLKAARLRPPFGMKYEKTD